MRRFFRNGLALASAIGLTASVSLPAMAQSGWSGAERSAPAPRRISRPDRRSLEYRLSWGLAAINADRAYSRGVNGNGVTVALIDTGIGGVPTGMFGSVSSASIDLGAPRKQVQGDAGHGEQTAGLLAAALDGSGTIGVAYGATLLSIRADIDGSCVTQCSVRGEVLAKAIDYALAQGARVIGVPLVGAHRLASVEPALERAARAGAVIVAAAGNDSAAAPSWPARYAADPRFRDSLIVAGASDIRGRLTRWTSKAGPAASRYIAAPGENVVVDCGPRLCWLVSGTSYSVSYVAGALALVMEAQPSLSPTQAARILLGSASDLGKRGHDPVAGTGILNVRRALQTAEREVRAPA